jgi:hypothetical protein
VKLTSAGSFVPDCLDHQGRLTFRVALGRVQAPRAALFFSVSRFWLAHLQIRGKMP